MVNWRSKSEYFSCKATSVNIVFIFDMIFCTKISFPGKTMSVTVAADYLKHRIQFLMKSYIINFYRASFLSALDKLDLLGVSFINPDIM